MLDMKYDDNMKEDDNKFLNEFTEAKETKKKQELTQIPPSGGRGRKEAIKNFILTRADLGRESGRKTFIYREKDAEDLEFKSVSAFGYALVNHPWNKFDLSYSEHIFQMFPEFNGIISTDEFMSALQFIHTQIPITTDFIKFNNGSLYIGNDREFKETNLEEYIENIKQYWFEGLYPRDEFIQQELNINLTFSDLNNGIIDFVEGVVNNKLGIEMFELVLGDMIKWERIINKLPILLGKSLIGKGSVLKMIRNLFKNNSEMRMQDIFFPGRFSFIPLLYANLIIIDELTHDYIKDLSNLKKLGTREKMSIELKGDNEIHNVESDLMPYFFGATNELPAMPFKKSTARRFWIINCLGKVYEIENKTFEDELVNNDLGLVKFVFKVLYTHDKYYNDIIHNRKTDVLDSFIEQSNTLLKDGTDIYGTIISYAFDIWKDDGSTDYMKAPFVEVSDVIEHAKLVSAALYNEGIIKDEIKIIGNSLKRQLNNIFGLDVSKRAFNEYDSDGEQIGTNNLTGYQGLILSKKYLDRGD
jgi:hypothetical protein